MILCVRMGIYPDDGDAENAKLQEISWCRRPILDGELTFPSAAHAVQAVQDMNGVWICDECAARLAGLILNNKCKRE